MSLLAEPIAGAPEDRDDAEWPPPGFYHCPRCPYSIALDFPTPDVREPIAAHENAHRLKDLGLEPKPQPAILRPGTPRR